jgi:hypothetical protein
LTTNDELREYLEERLFQIACGDKDLAYDGTIYIYPLHADLDELKEKAGIYDDVLL